MSSPNFASFLPLHYNLEKVGSLSQVMAPPYDVIDKAGREALLKKHPYNSVRLILGEGEWHTQAAQFLKEWRTQGVLCLKTSPLYGLYTQTFRDHKGQTRTRNTLFGSKRLEELGHGNVFPHERTLSAPKEDRLKLFDATQTQLSPVFGIFSDTSGTLQTLLEEEKRKKSWAQWDTEDGIHHELWFVEEPRVCQEIQAAMEDKEVLIADGHHRYETAWNYAQQHKGVKGVMMGLVSEEDEGLELLPTHRILKNWDKFSWEAFQASLDKNFQADRGLSIQEALTLLESLADTRMVFAVLRPGEKTATVYRRPLGVQRSSVVLLHEVVFEKILGLRSEDQVWGKNLAYVNPHEDPLARLKEEKGQALFLLPSPNIQEISEISRAGQRMPQKSTYFFPKLPTGIFFYPLKDS